MFHGVARQRINPEATGIELSMSGRIMMRTLPNDGFRGQFPERNA